MLLRGLALRQPDDEGAPGGFPVAYAPSWVVVLLQQAAERQRPGRQQRMHAGMQQVPRGHPPMLLDMLHPRRNVPQTL